MSELAELIAVSHYAGERFDLVQAGGGNTSLKLPDGGIHVKASGVALGEVKDAKDFAFLDWRPLLKFVEESSDEEDPRLLEERSKDVVKLATKSEGTRPSIEVLMHCLFGPLTLHSHPIAANALTCREGWRDTIKRLFPTAILVPYRTPGAPLAVAVSAALKQSNWQSGSEALVFLENHGLIASAATLRRVVELTDQVASVLNEQLGLTLGHYALSNFVSSVIASVTGAKRIAFLIEDLQLNRIAKDNFAALSAPPAVPDHLIYCGIKPLILTNADPAQAEKSLKAFVEQYGMPPSVVIVEWQSQPHCFAIGQTLRKAREVEDVLKSHVMILDAKIEAPVQHLAQDEITYLSNWEAEKYRKNL